MFSWLTVATIFCLYRFSVVTDMELWVQGMGAVDGLFSVLLLSDVTQAA